MEDAVLDGEDPAGGRLAEDPPVGGGVEPQDALLGKVGAGDGMDLHPLVDAAKTAGRADIDIAGGILLLAHFTTS